ncbi:lipid-A-disaccharide synthase-related protein [Prochlorococcus marinus]|uniref:lipid-A-disaccharide synthase-related protein n=1 Tax=Prochlorococcus marinus TaxID=1219 RepID=UPI0022B2DD36|nr:lipid-A-disaccharide synthase-related protein [Prochlorococcus marinus]
MANLLLISNGHGEDLSGALIGLKLKQQGHKIDAFPLVGKGNAYEKRGITIHGLRKEFSTGGLGYTSLIGRFTELFQGQLFYLAWSYLRLLTISRHYDCLVVVGDVVPVFVAWLSHVPSAVYLVAYSSHYEGKLRLPWPAAQCLRSKRFLRIFSRDKLTSEDLSRQLNRPVVFCGNPFMDAVLSPKEQLPKKTFRLGLLPGSRRPELETNLLMILKVLDCLPESILVNPTISFDMALVDTLENHELIALTARHGWHVINKDNQLHSITLNKGLCCLTVYRDSFVELLQSSDALLSMAGTAAEQAVGLAKPVIQLPGLGPQFTPAFAEAQRRLLGETVFCVETNKAHERDIFIETATLIMMIFSKLNENDHLKMLCHKQGLARLGQKGGTQLIADSISSLLPGN